MYACVNSYRCDLQLYQIALLHSLKGNCNKTELKMSVSSIDVSIIFKAPYLFCRRLQYLVNQSVHSHSPRVKRRKVDICDTPLRQTTRHKVWKPDVDTDKDNNNKILLNGFELKTKQGNKQWLSEAAALINTKRKQRKSLGKKKVNVVNVMGAQYAMATSGKSLKKILTSPSKSMYMWSEAHI